MYRIQGNTLSAKTPRSFWLAASGMMFATAIALVPSPVSAGDGNDRDRNLGPGCAPDRPAIAHHFGGVIATLPPGQAMKAPIPCSTNTGFRSSEIAVVVSNTGVVVLQPEFPASGFPIGTVRSTDDGAHWNAVLPSNPNNPPRVTPVDNNMNVDRDTGRIFWIVGQPGESVQIPRLDMSDDSGATWFSATNPGTIRLIDHSQIFFGPPPKSVKPMMGSYPNVVYLCQGSGPQFCQYSLDGGNSFNAGVALPIPPEAGTTCSNFGLKGVVAKDGTLYVPSTPCDRPYVGISHDAGSTWQQVLVADVTTIGFGELSLGIDKQGNLYSTWVGVNDRLPYLAISRDGGQTWSKPLMIGAPGVNEAAIPQLVAGKRGHVAVAYYGSKNSPGKPFPPVCAGLPPVTQSPLSTSCPAYQNETWNTYITESWMPLDQTPLFWSAPLNDPKTPTWFGCSPSAVGVGGEPATQVSVGCLGTSDSGPPFWGRIDYFSLTMDAHETPWAGLVQECPGGLPTPRVPYCSGGKGQPQDSLWSIVGRLVPSRGNDNDED